MLACVRVQRKCYFVIVKVRLVCQSAYKRKSVPPAEGIVSLGKYFRVHVPSSGVRSSLGLQNNIYTKSRSLFE